jgi:hypothetical protein
MLFVSTGLHSYATSSTAYRKQRYHLAINGASIGRVSFGQNIKAGLHLNAIVLKIFWSVVVSMGVDIMVNRPSYHQPRGKV